MTKRFDVSLRDFRNFKSHGKNRHIPKQAQLFLTLRMVAVPEFFENRVAGYEFVFVFVTLVVPRCSARDGRTPVQGEGRGEGGR